MKRIYVLIMFLLLNTVPIKSQQGKVGIETETPTEIFDVKGTARLRSTPNDGTANSIYTQANGTASSTLNQTFKASNLVVSDVNGVLGKLDTGFPVTSVTQTFIAPSGGFTTGTATNPTYRVAIGTLEVGFFQTTNNNQLYVVFRSTQPGMDTYTADLREFGGTFQDWRFTGTLASGTWSSTVGWIGIGVDTWLMNINFQSLNRIYRITVLGARWSGGAQNTTTQGDQFTVNLQQLSGILP